MENDNMTVIEVAEYLRVSRQTVYIMIRGGKIPHFRVGNKVRVKRSDLEAMTSTQSQPETSEQL